MARSSSGRRLGRTFFDRPTVRVAHDLLGAVLRVRRGSRVRSVRLVEVEAYTARDPASHAFRGPTRRNRSMFGPPGTVYVYRIHQVVCVNLVTRPGEAVLLRAGDPLSPVGMNPSGPGRLCRALGIRLSDDGSSVVRSGRISVVGARAAQGTVHVVRSPRVGISRAVDRPLRFSEAGNPWVSRPRPTSASPS